MELKTLPKWAIIPFSKWNLASSKDVNEHIGGWSLEPSDLNLTACPVHSAYVWRSDFQLGPGGPLVVYE